MRSGALCLPCQLCLDTPATLPASPARPPLSAPQEVLAAAESAAASCRTAVMAYRERLPLMLNLPSFLPPPPDFLAAMEARAAEAEQLLEAITAGTYVPPVAVAAPAPAVAAPVVAPVEHLPSGGAPAAVPGDLAALERRLAELEDQSSQVDMQVCICLCDCAVLVLCL